MASQEFFHSIPAVLVDQAEKAGYKTFVGDGTAILSVLQIGELMSVASRISNATFRPVEIFSFVALVYLVIGYGFSRLAALLEGHMARSERPAA